MKEGLESEVCKLEAVDGSEKEGKGKRVREKLDGQVFYLRGTKRRAGAIEACP